MLLADVVFFHHALQPVAFGFESGQPGARCADLARKNHCSIRIMVQFSSTGGRQVREVDRPPLVPSCRTHNSEISAAAALSRRPALDLLLSTQLRPYRRAGIRLRRRSCSHIAKPRTRYRHPLRNTWSIQNSCLPTQPATEALESSPQNSAKFLPPAGFESPACWYGVYEKGHCETVRTACV